MRSLLSTCVPMKAPTSYGMAAESPLEPHQVKKSFCSPRRERVGLDDLATLL
ncbi:hypothetical protein HanXRQr2_Chr14g0655991 [Helianthus annuus]|uniref:Uncharacterized protein n=1 Tax=Helianthus annuus TaxID=4232 RepID=A0A9K3H8M2_HELAN|nr:hypothetical protein HanXRQr2_Chr14g0655991 [Helianthus annuus]